jgi:hypothetical protein
MHKTHIIVLSIALGLALITLPGCGRNSSQKLAEKVASKVATAATGGKTSVNVGSNVDLSALPANLRYPGATATASWTTTQDSAKGTYYALESADPIATVKDFYKKNMTGWTQSMAMDNADGTSMLSYASPDQKQNAVITLAIDKTKGTTTIAIIYTTK